VENKTCFSRKYQCGSRRSCVSREKGKMRWYIVKLASLAVCESCNLRDLQISKIIIHSEKLVWDPKFSQDTCKTPESKLVMILGSLAAKFLFARLAVSLWNLSVRLTRSESCYNISFCETRKNWFLLRNFCLRDSREASLTTNFDSRVLRESRETFGSKKQVWLLARISKSDSRVPGSESFE
jgi:hypothetical protein